MGHEKSIEINNVEECLALLKAFVESKKNMIDIESTVISTSEDDSEKFSI